MNPTLTLDIKEIMEVVHYRPAVSIIMPLEPKLNLKSKIVQAFKIATDKAERELQNNFPDELTNIVIKKLKTIINSLDYSINKKSITIYVSPVFEKVLFLDIPVEEKIIVDQSFEIRDLVYSKKQLDKYLVMLLSGKEVRIYLSNMNSFIRIPSTIPESINAYLNEIPEKVANFSDSNDRKEIMMDKFLHHIDNELNAILNLYPLPIFILASEKIIGHFKKITKHAEAVIAYVHGNYEEASFAQLNEILKPYIATWKKEKQDELFNKLEDAAGKKNLVKGIKDVWREAMNNKGSLLLVEKNYMVAAEMGSSNDIINLLNEPYNKFSFIKDAVDDVIEKVLNNGGEVEFVDNLKDYQHIALILYY